MPQFAAVRIGKDSKTFALEINNRHEPPQQAVEYKISCAQLPPEFEVGHYALVWLSAESNKVKTTKWEQGLRGLGRVTKLTRAAKYNGTSTFTLSAGVFWDHSLDQHALLAIEPSVYVTVSRMPVIGIRDWSGQTVRCIDITKKHSNIRSLFALLVSKYPRVSDDVKAVYPELSEFLPLPGKPIEAVGPGGQPTTVVMKAQGTGHLGVSKIFYGAPGAGKSFRADREATAICEAPDVIRTVFHADYTRGEFIGRYQPVSGKADGPPVTYQFVPGPFTQALVRAVESPEKHVTLIIEELNRANAPAVFGEVFQLLDREAGKSRYLVKCDPTFRDYLTSTVGETFKSGLFIPSNLSIFATMNSADQGVQHLDAAFKRRWQFAYVPLNFAECPWRSDSMPYAGTKPTWEKFATTINRRLSTMSLPEDRLIGPYFLTQEDLGNTDLIASKLLLYLWDDVLRFAGRNQLFSGALCSSTFSAVCDAFSHQLQVFDDALHTELTAKDQPPSEK